MPVPGRRPTPSKKAPAAPLRRTPSEVHTPSFTSSPMERVSTPFSSSMTDLLIRGNGASEKKGSDAASSSSSISRPALPDVPPRRPQPGVRMRSSTVAVAEGASERPAFLSSMEAGKKSTAPSGAAKPLAGSRKVGPTTSAPTTSAPTTSAPTTSASTPSGPPLPKRAAGLQHGKMRRCVHGTRTARRILLTPLEWIPSYCPLT